MILYGAFSYFKSPFDHRELDLSLSCSEPGDDATDLWLNMSDVGWF